MANNNALIGAAGVHHVVSELCRRGMVALPTVRNTAAYDIVVVNADGTRHANVQVKASYKRVADFPMPAADKVRAGRHDYYVLARWLEREARYECFLLTGRQARDEVRRTDVKKREAIAAGTKKPGVFIHGVSVASSNGAAADRWRTAWERWRL
jgi:hypothetical protein